MEAWAILNDGTTTELFFGGAAGPGKSYLGCAWLLVNCLRYPGSRWLMGRAHLKNLKESTLLTFFQVCKDWGIKKDEHFTYGSMESVLRFFNGSEIYLKDLFAYPSDPEFDSFGSTEFTGAFFDEGSELTEKAKNIATSRLRYKLEEFKLIPKLLVASNPAKNFLYYQFYKPHKDGKLPPFRKFIQALVSDNPYISPQYKEQLQRLDKVSKERLLFGNFEYDDDPAKLMQYDKILDIFTNAKQPFTSKYISCDIARFGSDKTIAVVWEGLHVKEIKAWQKESTKQTRLRLEEMAAKEQIPHSNIIIDEDGVGGGVKDEMEGIYGFVNNSSAVNGQNYANLKTQCYYKLADYINQGKISCGTLEPRIKEMLIEDLEQVARDKPDKDSKISIVPKEKVKEKLGRSCDVSDAIMLRMYYEVWGNTEWVVAKRGF